MELARGLYILIKHEHSITCTSPSLRVRDFLNYQDNIVSIKAHYETLFNYFKRQLAQESALTNNDNSSKSKKSFAVSTVSTSNFVNELHQDSIDRKTLLD